MSGKPMTAADRPTIVSRAFVAIMFAAAILFAIFGLVRCISTAHAQAVAAPDDAKVPGQWRADLTEEQIRSTTWGDDERMVTAAMRAAVDKRDRVSGTKDASCGTPGCELDHRDPRCLGGADAVANLYMQKAPEWHLKDLVETITCKDYKDGKVDLKTARARFEKGHDWRVAFRALCAASRIPAHDCALLK